MGDHEVLQVLYAELQGARAQGGQLLASVAASAQRRARGRQQQVRPRRVDRCAERHPLELAVAALLDVETHRRPRGRLVA